MNQKISKAIKQISVSKNLPFLYDHSFSSLSTVDRIAQVNQPHEWLILGQPLYPFSSANKISRIVLSPPDVFGYPENSPVWSCSFYGEKRYKFIPQDDYCQVERVGGKTLINIDLKPNDWADQVQTQQDTISSSLT